jgi:mercuric ion transport protein
MNGRARRIQLLVFEGCPLADAARRSLESALAQIDAAEYEEIDLLAPDTPEDLRRWGSPTILVDGKDVAGAPQGQGIGCRVYASPEGVPSPESIAASILEAWPE